MEVALQPTDWAKKEALLKAYELIQPLIHRTPVHSSSQIDQLLGAEIYFKCENFQKAGSYKIRGACHALLKLRPDQREKGVVTHSSGNFAQAVAMAARLLKVPAYIVMPENAPEVKRKAVLGYGGQVTTCPPTMEARETYAQKIVESKGATLLHPSNDPQVILGQGTACLELLEDTEALDRVIVPVGGGGLIAGTALACRYFSKKTTVIGAEPMEADDAYRSLKSGRILMNETANTIADGLRSHLGSFNFPIIQEGVSEIIRVTETEIIAAMRLIYERMKLVVEPSSAVALAALIKEKSRLASGKTGIVISGGNVDVSALPF